MITPTALKTLHVSLTISGMQSQSSTSVITHSLTRFHHSTSNAGFTAAVSCSSCKRITFGPTRSLSSRIGVTAPLHSGIGVSFLRVSVKDCCAKGLACISLVCVTRSVP